MSTVKNNLSTEPQAPAKSEVALLALKFYIDSGYELGREWENLLCAEYMLAQKHLIQSQIKALHEGRSLSPAA